MSFRDEMMRDIDETFLEADEFASEHVVEGKRILCVVDEAKSAPKDANFNLAQADFVLLAKTADLPPRKAAGALLNLDGRELTVGAWSDEDGMTSVELFAPESA